ncbi:MAG: Polynucleotide 5'-kinase, involved in rRNA processing Grc3 [Candidatus Methanohalarchaeum thermophilum]|uniref:Polynucleotide 5'-kinase, involved in rRNA processing Grc3 n=1 Tax=Methanohalarchaeum thermophilum TaxID=1903181 RepID=A0A1Q6DWR5_METT1|nr:MAG: Polynucleotide 5'-kinase, involved in rRNA processing Grc3 [Candidatus Methanohalarchaeum thermophilum]
MPPSNHLRSGPGLSKKLYSGRFPGSAKEIYTQKRVQRLQSVHGLLVRLQPLATSKTWSIEPFKHYRLIHFSIKIKDFRRGLLYSKRIKDRFDLEKLTVRTPMLFDNLLVGLLDSDEEFVSLGVLEKIDLMDFEAEIRLPSFSDDFKIIQSGRLE